MDELTRIAPVTEADPPNTPLFNTLSCAAPDISEPTLNVFARTAADPPEITEPIVSLLPTEQVSEQTAEPKHDRDRPVMLFATDSLSAIAADDTESDAEIKPESALTGPASLHPPETDIWLPSWKSPATELRPDTTAKPPTDNELNPPTPTRPCTESPESTKALAWTESLPPTTTRPEVETIPPRRDSAITENVAVCVSLRILADAEEHVR